MDQQEIAADIAGHGRLREQRTDDAGSGVTAWKSFASGECRVR